MRGAGLVDTKVAWVNQMSWSAIGTKPLDTGNEEWRS